MKFRMVSDYLYMLLEQLRFLNGESWAGENFNDTAFPGDCRPDYRPSLYPAQDVETCPL